LTRDEHNELADLWGGSGPAGDRDEVARMARAIPRRARIAHVGELAVVALLCAGIVGSILWSRGPATILTGGLLLVLLGWSARKRHYLGKVALLIDDSDRLTFVRSSVRAKEAELRRSGLGLAMIVPGFVIAVLLGFSLQGHRGADDVGAFLLASASSPRGIIVLACVAAAAVLLSRSHVRVREELAHLRQLERQYLDEERSGDAAAL
jgi:hypothetical protein